MLLDSLFQSFLNKRPICVMAQAVLMRILNPERLDELFEQTAEKQYPQTLLFSSVAQLMADVVFQIQPSVHAAYQSKNYNLGVSANALYKKIDHLEPNVSAQLVRDSAAQATELIDALQAQLPPWLSGFRCRVLDGNHFEATQHRLQPLRQSWAAPLPDSLFTIINPQRLIIDYVLLCEVGHTQERSLIDEVLAKVQANDLWIADRNFCTKKFMAKLIQKQAFFLFRQHGTLQGQLVGKQQHKGKSEHPKCTNKHYCCTKPLRANTWCCGALPCS